MVTYIDELKKYQLRFENGFNPYVATKVHLYLLRFYLYINSFL